jgi:hypothetical protein
MLDLSHIPNSQQDVRIFFTNGSTNAWQTWTKPKKCNYVWIMCIGGGGGGAGGAVNSSNVYSTGGASGGVSRTLFNAQQLPDTLYVQVGTGGAGGTSGGAGSAGTRSFVSLTPLISSATSIAGSGTTGAAGGTSGTGASAAGEPAPAQGNVYFLCLANFLNVAGVNAAGSLTAQAPNITPLTSQITCPGGGGSAGIPNALSGSSILSSSFSPLISGGAGTVVSGSIGGNGADGITSWKPFFSTGGAGGGSSVSGSGGNGGNGGIGSGGGGGGGRSLLSGAVGGTGGKGGDGLVVIIAF